MPYDFNQSTQGVSQAELHRRLKSRAETGSNISGRIANGDAFLSNTLGVGSPSPVGRRQRLSVEQSLQTAGPLPNAKTRCSPAEIAAAPQGSPCARFRKKNLSDTNLMTLVYV